MSPVLEASRAKRDKKQTKLDELLAAPTAEARALTADEAAKFEELAADIDGIDKSIRALEKDEKRRTKAEDASAATEDKRAVVKTGDLVVRSEPKTYDRDLRESYFRDMAYIAASSQAGLDPTAARERLARHAHEVDVEARTDATIREYLREIRASPQSLRGQTDFESRVNPNTTAGTGGEFVPPLWLVSQYAPFLRPTRIAANRCSNMPLPPGIDIINLPKITTGSATAIQTAQGGAVQSVDIVTSTVSASVRTIAGQEDISLQLLEQSPLSMDGVIFDDLMRDYDQRLDQQILYGTGANGQHQGVITLTSATSNTDITKANAITVASAVFHDASTTGTQYRSIVNGVNQIETLRFAPPTAIWAHPRRVNSWAYASDTTARPLFVPGKYGQYNTVGTAETGPTPQGIAGEMFGLPVIKDANMPTTMLGTATTGGTADCVVVHKEDDMWLYEGTLRARALPEILSGTLQIRYQVYCYSAFLPNRFAPSVSILTGNAGLASPGF